MREIATRFVLLLAAAGLEPMCALALEFDVTGAQSCSAIRCPSRYQRVEPPIKNPTGQGCNTDFRYVRCGGTADLMRTRSVLLERTPAVMRDGVPPHRQFRSDSSLSLYPVQWPVADNVWFEHLGGHRGRLDDGDSAAVIESWSTLAYRFSPDIGPSGTGFSHLDRFKTPAAIGCSGLSFWTTSVTTNGPRGARRIQFRNRVASRPRLSACSAYTR